MVDVGNESVDETKTLARDISTPLALLEVLAGDKNRLVRGHVAYNSNTPLELLEVLSRDRSYRVWCGVAANPATSPALLEVLGRDEDVRVVAWAVKVIVGGGDVEHGSGF